MEANTTGTVEEGGSSSKGEERVTCALQRLGGGEGDLERRSAQQQEEPFTNEGGLLGMEAVTCKPWT